ncbi:MAG: cbb3-type cytochrome c oxidase subunit I [Planctomycetes bacterium]|nr:cbb3-type cytochrome c oxidase subunit I [Planctomycetota bacterium]
MSQDVPAAAARPLVIRGLVAAHFAAAVASLVVSVTGGFLFSLLFVQRYPFEGVELLSPGRVRMVHTNLIAFGFLFNGFLGALYWALPRVTGRPVLDARLGWLIFWVWQGVLLAVFLGILAGHAQAVEWGETPVWIDPAVVLGAVLLMVQFLPCVARSGEKALYVTAWYVTAGLIWTGLTYIMGNYLPQFFVPGASGAAITGLYIHDLVGLFVTPMGWGLMYYFVPTILKKPVFSHGLSLIGFWGLAFFYPLNGVHHFLYSPIPMYAQYGAVVSTVAVEVVVTTVIVNFFMTLRGRGDMLRTSLPIRWFFTGMVFYFITCLQCAYQVTLTAQKIVHFTDWVVGHSHLVMFGVFSFWVLGMIEHLWPRLAGREWHAPAWNAWCYWLSTIGMSAMFVTLVAAGLLQGFLWKELAPWEASVVSSMPFWLARTLSGVMIVLGIFLFGLNMLLTAFAPAPRTEARPALAAARE